jgi:hypothetical protein
MSNLIILIKTTKFISCFDQNVQVDKKIHYLKKTSRTTKQISGFDEFRQETNDTVFM